MTSAVHCDWQAMWKIILLKIMEIDKIVKMLSYKFNLTLVETLQVAMMGLIDFYGHS